MKYGFGDRHYGSRGGTNGWCLTSSETIRFGTVLLDDRVLAGPGPNELLDPNPEQLVRLMRSERGTSYE